MLNLKVIGAGAAGNKAAIDLVAAGFDAKNVTLINSTLKDIPSDFKNSAILFGQNSDSLGGCGKEREIGKKLFITDFKLGTVSLDNIADPNTNAIVIVSSTEGGSGSAATPIIAKYISNCLAIPVIVVLFFGFNSDVRGMQNSIEICQELPEDATIIGICNSKYLAEAGNNKIKAEKLANQEFVNIVRILGGYDVVESSQNIDDTDLYKIVSTPGYMMVGSTSIKSVKNIDQFNKTIEEAIDQSKLMDPNDKGAKRIGTFFDISEQMKDNVDYSCPVLQTEYGVPYESYTHVQEEGKNTVTWIVSGLPMPIDQVTEIYNNYMEQSNQVNKSKDDFFSVVGSFQGNAQDNMFNMLSTNRKAVPVQSKAAFLSEFGVTSNEGKQSGSKKTDEY